MKRCLTFIRLFSSTSYNDIKKTAVDESRLDLTMLRKQMKKGIDAAKPNQNE